MHAQLATPRGGPRGFMHCIAHACLRAVLLAVVLAATGARSVQAQTTSVDSTAALLWTAPGDDGNTGRAARYEMRMRSTAITGTDTLSWWNAATVVPSLPSPSVAGATDSVQVHGIDPARTWYFILRTADEVPNWSNFSNIAIRSPYVDRVPPAAITDLSRNAAAANGPGLPASIQGIIRPQD